MAEFYRLPLLSFRNLVYLAGVKKQHSLDGLFANPSQLSNKGAA